MPPTFSDEQKSILDSPNFAHVATLFRDGTPQVNPVWVDRDGDLVRINSAEGRAKVRNLRADPRITIEVSNSENPYRYVEVRGKVVEFTHEGADDHIDALAKKYMDVDSYPLRKADEQRVTIVIQPEKIVGSS
ncbi:MAG: PPOX class F420-dependent oxidoreductase [Solirubrobacterales bacterium]|nr:PPOX class F420-dependent oxidoreductase [Solirubrobacterales bacterium]